MEHYQRYINEGYSEEQAFYLAEIRTTQQILIDLEDMGEYTPTLLLNSLLSMIVLPYEKAKSNGTDKVFTGRFSTLKTQLGIEPTLFEPIKKCNNCQVKYNNKVISIFINKLRNGIAHQNIAVRIIDDKEFEITIKNKYSNNGCNGCPNPVCKQKGLKRENGGVIDFEITVTVEQLRSLADYIAESYLRAIEQGGNECPN